MERTAVVPDKSILKIDLSEAIVDSPSSDPLGGLDPLTFRVTKELTMFDILRALDAAATDDRIQGIYLRLGMGAAPSVRRSWRRSVRRSTSSARAASSSSPTPRPIRRGYYLASVADAVYIQPEGGSTGRASPSI